MKNSEMRFTFLNVCFQLVTAMDCRKHAILIWIYTSKLAMEATAPTAGTTRMGQIVRTVSLISSEILIALVWIANAIQSVSRT